MPPERSRGCQRAVCTIEPRHLAGDGDLNLRNWEPGLLHIRIPLRVGWATPRGASFPKAVSFPPTFSRITYEAPMSSCSLKLWDPILAPPGPWKGLFDTHCTDGSPRPARLAFLFLCFLLGSGKVGSLDRLALRVTGVSLGQVGSISLGDPSLREGHPCCYFQLLQVGPGLLPPPAGHSCSDLVACRISHDVKHPPCPGCVGSTPHSAPHPFSGGSGESQGVSSAIWAQGTSA